MCLCQVQRRDAPDYGGPNPVVITLRPSTCVSGPTPTAHRVFVDVCVGVWVWHAETHPLCRSNNASVCTFQQRLCVCRRNVHMFKRIWLCCRYKRRRFECTHRGDLDLYTPAFVRVNACRVNTCTRGSAKGTTAWRYHLKATQLQLS